MPFRRTSSPEATTRSPCSAASASAALEAAEAYRSGGDSERAGAEESEAALISSYLPAEMSDDELSAIVDEAISAVGASGPQDTGKVMGAAMGKVAGRADGKRVSALVRDRLAGS